MQFGGSSNEIKELSPLKPGIYKNIVLAKVEALTTEGKDGKPGYEVLDFYFEGIGFNFLKRIFNPLKGEDQEKVGKAAKNASAIVLYIASKILNRDVNLPSVSTWDEFTTASIGLFKQGFNKELLQMKLVGNVYNGKARVDTTYYFGWLKRMDEGVELEFSKQEKEENAKWEAHNNGASAAKGSGGSQIKPDAGTTAFLPDEDDE
jgi:hypothetical protein